MVESHYRPRSVRVWSDIDGVHEHTNHCELGTICRSKTSASLTSTLLATKRSLTIDVLHQLWRKYSRVRTQGVSAKFGASDRNLSPRSFVNHIMGDTVLISKSSRLTPNIWREQSIKQC